MDTEEKESIQLLSEGAANSLPDESVPSAAAAFVDTPLPNGETLVNGCGPVPAHGSVDVQKAPLNQSLEAIWRKLSIAGLTDEVPLSAAPTPQPLKKPKLSHRRSRSLGDLTFNGALELARTTPNDDAIAPPVSKGVVAAARSLKSSRTNVVCTSEKLEDLKQSLLREIKTKLQKQIESKKLECHTDAQEEGVVTTADSESKSQEQQQQEIVVDNSQSPTAEDTPVKVQESSGKRAEDATKRFSVCSLSGVELRKPYTPVYERTRKLIRGSSGSSINRSTSSQPQPTSPSSPSASVDTQGTAVLSPVTSKGDLEEEMETPAAVVTAPVVEQVCLTSNGDGAVPPSQPTLHTMTSSSTRIGQYSAHPSVYVIEQQESRLGGSTGFDSRSDKMDRSTSTLKRGASFKGLRKNIKKTFSTQIPPLTLEKADKAPDTNVPAIVMCCVETLRRKGFLKTEGLYRSSPSQLEVRKVIKHARKGEYDYVQSVDDPVILAGTLKSFFFNLKNHLISEAVMEKNFPQKSLLGNLGEQEYIDRLKGVVSDLDTTHYESLEYLIKHLQEVASYSKFNLMTPSNLGVVWSPCLFTNCDKSLSGADLLSFMGEQTKLLELLITHADAIFDRYTLDEIMIAIEDGYPADSFRDGESTLNLQPDFDSILGGTVGRRGARADDFERRKLLRNLSLTFENVFEATNAEQNGDSVRRHYNLQNSATVPAITSAQSDGTVTRQRVQKMKRTRSKAACVVS